MDRSQFSFKIVMNKLIKLITLLPDKLNQYEEKAKQNPNLMKQIAKYTDQI